MLDRDFSFWTAIMLLMTIAACLVAYSAGRSEGERNAMVTRKAKDPSVVEIPMRAFERRDYSEIVMDRRDFTVYIHPTQRDMEISATLVARGKRVKP